MHGIINIDKPLGITSMDVVRKIRQATGVRKVGHGGTLDPMASGVIPVGIGNATRILEYIVLYDKSYIAHIYLGESTDTFDSEGHIVNTNGTPPNNSDMIDKTLNEFRGEIMQTPPPYSAIKKNGTRLYELARRGQDTYIDPRKAMVHELKIRKYSPPILELFVRCGKGFYVRSLANDLGITLGCGGYIKNLRRTSVGKFDITNSITLPKALITIENGDTSDIIQPMGMCLNNFKRVDLSAEETNMIRNGQKIPYKEIYITPGEPLAAAFEPKGALAAIIMFEDNSCEWKPVKVFL